MYPNVLPTLADFSTLMLSIAGSMFINTASITLLLIFIVFNFIQRNSKG